MTKKLVVLVLGICLAAQAEERTFVGTLADINLASFEWEDRSWSSVTWKEFIEGHMKRRMAPSPTVKRENGFKFYRELEKLEPIAESVLIDKELVWKDLTLFCGQQKKAVYVADALSRTKSELGKISQFLLLASPINDVARLKKRQAVIKKLMDDEQVYTSIDNLFASTQLPEIGFLSFYGIDLFEQTVNRTNTFSLKPLKSLNTSSSLLLLKSRYGHIERTTMTGSSLCGALACAVYGVSALTGLQSRYHTRIENWANSSMGGFASPYRWIWNAGNRQIRGGLALSTAVLLGYGFMYSVEWFKGVFLFEKSLHTITNQLAEFMISAERAYEIVRQTPEFADFDEFKGLVEFFEERVPASKKLQEFTDLLATSTFKKEPSVFAHKGRIVRAYLLMHEIKEELIPLGASIGALDCYLSYATLMKEYKEKSVSFCFPTYVDAEKPRLSLTDFWHPLIDVDKVVPNSVALGDGHRQNMLITGPNAAGKSTLMKAMSLCVLCAQTIGIVPASEMTYTPFTRIKTYLNIVDDIGAGNSLFMAEAQQSQRIIDTVENSSEKEFTFACFDEIFNGTSPVEGSAAAYSVAAHLGQFDNCLCMIATHFPLLTKLEKATQSFKNYKVSVSHKDGELVYPYKLQEGSSTQYVALDVLKEQGFTGSLLEEAQKQVEQATA